MYSIFIEEAPDGEEEAVISDQGIYFHLNTYHAGSIIITESLLKKNHLKFLAKKKQVTMEIAWSAVRPVRNRLLLGVFRFVHPLIVLSEA